MMHGLTNLKITKLTVTSSLRRRL